MNTSEEIALDLVATLDPVAFAAKVGIPNLDPWQDRALRSTSHAQLWNVSRQAGKSTTAALLAAWTALYRPEVLVLAVSPSQRQSGELLAKVKSIIRHVESPAQESESRVRLANGSRVLALPGGEDGDSIRGYTADLVIFDEASRVEDAVYAAVRPALAVSGGRLVALSTPAGARGWWWEEWTTGGARWERTEVPASSIPRISPEFLEGERRSLGTWVYQAEYECAFTSTQAAVFSADDLASVFGS